MNRFMIGVMKKFITNHDLARLKKDVKPHEGVTAIRDISYRDNGKAEHTLDVLFPDGTNCPLPTIFNVHGGGYSSGDKSIYDNYCLRLAICGYTVININYGLAPDYIYPSQAKDVLAAMKFVKENAAKYNVDLENFYVVGDSAGGNMTAYVGVLQCNPEFAKRNDLVLPLKVKALGLSCGAYNGDSNSNKVIKMMNGIYFNKKPKDMPPLAEYDIYTNMNSDFPPAFLTSCADDILYQDNLAMDKKLEELGIEHKTIIYDKTHNPLGHVFNYRWIDNKGKVMPEAVEVRDEMFKFFMALK